MIREWVLGGLSQVWTSIGVECGVDPSDNLSG